jgi:hypothetical protein
MTQLRLSKLVTFTGIAIVTILLNKQGFSQNTTIVDTTNPNSAKVIAGEEYKRSKLGRFFWGEHYRKEWTTPVNVSKIRLDTAFGGLKPTETGGGKQTKNLRFQAKNGREYAIRSVNKDYGKALPEDVQGTFIESIVKDQMSVAHPYAGYVLGALSDAAKVYSTYPKVVFVGDDPALGKFRDEFKNDLYSLEDRPTDENAKFYGAKDVLDTEDFLELILKDNRHRADPETFIRARLFDMLIGDWDRHDDQWKWAEFEQNGMHIYKALPKDRDQAFSKFDGFFVRIMVAAARLPYLQGFKNDIEDIAGFNLEARPLDMHITNGTPLETWRRIASDMQQSLTDASIENAIKLLPPEVYVLSGEEMIRKLKSRRDLLVSLAERYYRNLSNEVDIIGSDRSELVEVIGVDKEHVTVNVYDGTNKSKAPFISRTFAADETDEIRIYGIGGNDQFVTSGTTGKQFVIRFIGGKEKDVFTVPSTFKGRVNIYDNYDNSIDGTGAEKHLSTDSAVHTFNRKGYKANSSSFFPKIGFTNEDRIFVGLAWRSIKQQFRKAPFGYKNEIAALYSITQQGFRVYYKGTFNEVLGKWNLGLLADYDQIRDAHFLGIGNNTIRGDIERRYSLYENKEINGGLSVFRLFDSAHTVRFSAFYQMVEILRDTASFFTKQFAPFNQKAFEPEQFVGLEAEYDYTKVNSLVTPNKGVRFYTGVEYTNNIKNANYVLRFSGLFGFYVPLGPLTLAVKTGAATLTGEPEFYQLNKIGGGITLRGYSRFRFYGKTMFFNQNELQWNFNVRSYLFNGKMGLVALFDQGRVWMPGETSKKWHTAVGGGITIAPFNMISVTGTYAVSPEDQRISLRIGHFLRR